ncbi:MAG: peptidylprolyl isomerase [Acidobacteriota bacterium]|nr:peptidylprolyl isomerase [Acidobacteriota bacterium]
MRQLFFLALILTLGACNRSVPATKVSVEPAEDQLFQLDGDYAASHILVAYQGADRAAPEITRTREQAKQKAEELAQTLTTEPDRFEELARENSDGPTKIIGGNLGSWFEGNMAPEFEVTTKGLEIGEITRMPVETAFGFHIIRRNAMKVKHYGGEGFFIAYKGAPQAPESVTRTREEARALAEKVSGEMTPQNFQALAEEHNDLGAGPMFLGVFNETEPLQGDLLTNMANLDFGMVSGPIEFPVGFGLVRRIRLEKRSGAHVLIAHKESEGKARVDRTREEARARAVELIAELKSGERTFEDTAKEFSDGPSASHGGLLGSWFRGNMLPPFEQAMDKLQPGQITEEPVETIYGYHIIRRDKVE